MARTTIPGHQVTDASIKNDDIASDAAIAHSKLANVSASSRVLGRKSSGAGAIEELTVDEILAFLTDNTTNDVSTSKHGLVPKAPNDTTKFLRGDASWAVPSGGATFITAIKTADEIVNNSNTYQDDNHIVGITLSANKTYRYWFFGIISATSGTPGFKAKLVTSANVAYSYSWLGNNDGSTLGFASSYSTADATPGSAGSYANAIYNFLNGHGSISVGGSDVTIKLQWAQLSAHASDTTLKQGASLILMEM